MAYAWIHRKMNYKMIMHTRQHAVDLKRRMEQKKMNFMWQVPHFAEDDGIFTHTQVSPYYDGVGVSHKQGKSYYEDIINRLLYPTIEVDYDVMNKAMYYAFS
jgi:hypothetical protein